MSTPRKEKKTRTCLLCSAEFKATLDRAAFCTGKCRVQYWRERKGDTTLLDALVLGGWRIVQMKSGAWYVMDTKGSDIGTGTTYRAALIAAVSQSPSCSGYSIPRLECK